jgi:drug/metabolite transporter (DMT)-like permease
LTKSPSESPSESTAWSPGAAVALLAFCVPVWGFNWPMMKIVLGDITPLWLGAIRMGVTSAVLFAALALMRRLRLPNRRDAPVLISVGVFMFAVYTILAMIGLSHAQAGRAALLTFVTPLWVTPLAIVILGERLSRLKAAGLVFAVGGLGVLFNPFGFDWSRTEVVIGNGLLLGASMAWATTIIHLRTHRWRLSPFELGPWQLLVATAVVAPAALAVEGVPEIAWTVELALLVAFAGPLATTLTVWGAIVVMRSLPATTSSPAFLATPVMGMVASALVLGEKLTLTNVAGLVLIVAGLGCVALSDARRAPVG